MDSNGLERQANRRTTCCPARGPAVNQSGQSSDAATRWQRRRQNTRLMNNPAGCTQLSWLLASNTDATDQQQTSIRNLPTTLHCSTSRKSARCFDCAKLAQRFSAKQIFGKEAEFGQNSGRICPPLFSFCGQKGRGRGAFRQRWRTN